MSERRMRTMGVDVVFLDLSRDMVELMNAVCRSTGWTWRPVEPDITWVDSPFAQ